MTDQDSRLARVEERTDSLREDMTEVKADVKAILATINQWRGGAAMGGLIGTVGGPILVKLLQKAGVW